jgi:hypothetical protein
MVVPPPLPQIWPVVNAEESPEQSPEQSPEANLRESPEANLDAEEGK